MLMTEVERGTNFWGRIHEQHTQDRSIFEGIVMNVEKCDYPHFKGYLVKSLIVYIKSSNPSLIGRTQVIDFTDKQMEEFYENGNSHFVSMENLYKVLNLYNPGNYYTSVMAVYFDENMDSMPIFSLLDERSPEYAFVFLTMLNKKIIQIISLMDTCMTLDYENPYVWLNVADSENELLLNESAESFFDNSYVYRRMNDIFLENIEKNPKLELFFGDFSMHSSIFNSFRGIGLSCDSELSLIIFDSQKQDMRICYGNGVSIKKEE